jgi:hypothetical protein
MANWELFRGGREPIEEKMYAIMVPRENEREGTI